MTLTWVQLVSAHDPMTLREHICSRIHMSGQVHYIVYMMDPIHEEYGVKLMCVLPSSVFGHMDFKRVIPLNMRMYPLLDCSMLKLFSN